VLAAGLRKCGWPCSREKLIQAMGDLTVDDQGLLDLNGTPVVFNATTHTSVEKGFRVYHWDPSSSALAPAVDWSKKAEQDWPGK
jgi:hypothetical protein